MIANQALGLPFKGHFFEFLSKNDQMGKVLKIIFNQFKTKFDKFDGNPNPLFKQIDEHTRFFYHLLTMKVKKRDKFNIADICLPKPKSDDLEYQSIDAIQG